MGSSVVLVVRREGEAVGADRDWSRWELRPLARAITAYWWAASERLELDRKGLGGLSWWGEKSDSWVVEGELRAGREGGRGWEGGW